MNPTSMPRNQKMKLEWLQVLRGIAAIMVVFCHLGIYEHKTLGNSGIIPAWVDAGAAGVDVFFVISGFIMAFITPDRFRKIPEWLAFLYRRFTRIFPPYWMVSLVLLLCWLRNPGLFNNFYHNQMNIGRSFILFPQSFPPLVAVGWSLIHEVYFYVLVSFIFLFAATSRIACLAGWFLLLLGVDVFCPLESFHGSPVKQLITSPFGLNFQAGMAIALTWKALTRLRLPPKLYFLLASAGFASLYLAGQFAPRFGVYPDNNYLCRAAYFGLPACLMVLSVVQLDAGAFFTAPRWAVLLGDASYAIYLLHLPIIVSLYGVCARLMPQPGFPAALCAFLVIAAMAILGPVLFYVTVERRLISFFHRNSPFKVRTGA